MRRLNLQGARTSEDAALDQRSLIIKDGMIKLIVLPPISCRFQPISGGFWAEAADYGPDLDVADGKWRSWIMKTLHPIRREDGDACWTDRNRASMFDISAD